VDAQARRFVGEVFRLQVLRGDRRKPFEASLDVLQPGEPLTLLGRVVPLVPLAESSEEAHDLFLAAFEGATIVVVGCSLEVRGPAEVFLPDEQTGGLRATHAFAAGVADEGGPVLDMDVGCDGLFRGGIDEDGDAFFLRDAADVRNAEGAGLRRGTGQDVDHGGATGELGAQLFG